MREKRDFMAPGSERADECKCEHPYRGARAVGTPDLCERCRALILPNEPTLTCPEVVERLHDCVSLISSQSYPYAPEPFFDEERAEAILHSWRERWVQDTRNSPEFLLFHRLWSKAVGTSDYVKSEWQKLEHALFYANSEWREQVRKGAKHE